MGQDSRYCSLIIPHGDWTHWTEEAESYHHIPRDSLFKHGRSIDTVADDMNRLLQNQTIYTDGWVVDQPWVIKLFHQCRKQMTFRISPLEMILNETQMELWHETKQQVTEDLGIDRHRASNDALIIQQTYNCTLELSQQQVSNAAVNRRA
ncbi:MAG: hypothetical protein OQK12_16935 [Motiliproteus sp.]|nr:hypothetical protein [Motiliproteus sp.]MCW9050734.1 hypothetical protein [Motiliproteus sp.]